MAHQLNNNLKHHHKKLNFWQNVGNRLKQGAQFAAGVKSLIDTGRTIYTGAQAVAPYIASAAPIIAGLRYLSF